MIAFQQSQECVAIPRIPLDELHWYAIHTRSRHEKFVTLQLQTKGVVSFLPLLHETHRWSDRSKVVGTPLFPGYVFVQIPNTGESRILVLRTMGVVGLVGARGSGVPIPDEQIESIQTILASELALGQCPFLRVGQRVRIRGGCLDGVQGILIDKKSDRSVVVSIHLIQRSLAVRVNGFDLELA